MSDRDIGPLLAWLRLGACRAGLRGADLDDAAQEAALRLVVLGVDRPSRGYAIRCGRNAALSIRRRRWATGDAAVWAAASCAPGPAEEAERSEQLARIEGALAATLTRRPSLFEDLAAGAPSYRRSRARRVVADAIGGLR